MTPLTVHNESYLAHVNQFVTPEKLIDSLHSNGITQEIITQISIWPGIWSSDIMGKNITTILAAITLLYGNGKTQEEMERECCRETMRSDKDILIVAPDSECELVLEYRGLVNFC